MVINAHAAICPASSDEEEDKPAPFKSCSRMMGCVKRKESKRGIAGVRAAAAVAVAVGVEAAGAPVLVVVALVACGCDGGRALFLVGGSIGIRRAVPCLLICGHLFTHAAVERAAGEEEALVGRRQEFLHLFYFVFCLGFGGWWRGGWSVSNGPMGVGSGVKADIHTYI